MTAWVSKKFAPFRISDFLCCLVIILLASRFILFTPPIASLKLLFLLLGFYFIGNNLTRYSGVLSQMHSLLQTALNILLGGFLYSFLLVIVYYLRIPVFTLQACLYLAGVLNFISPLNIKLDKIGLVCISPFLLFLLNAGEYKIASSQVFKDLVADSFYYTSIVKSLAINWSIYNPVYHLGIPMNYQVLTFFFPAAISSATQIDAHVSLWSIAMPLFKIFSFGTVSGFLFVFFRKAVNSEASNRYFLQLIISLSLLLLAPLNPKFLLSLDFQNFIFLGEGYLGPMGSIGYALGIWIFGVCCFLILEENTLNRFDFILAAILFASIIIIKTALFVPVYILFGIAWLINALKTKKIFNQNFWLLAISSLLAGSFYFLFFGNMGGMARINFSANGYYTTFLQNKANEYGLSSSIIIVLSLFGYMLLMWMGLKLFLLFYYFRKRNAFAAEYRTILIASALTLLLTLFPIFFVKMILVDSSNNILEDISFNMMEFFRSGWFIVNCCFIPIIPLIFFNRKITDRIMQVLIVVWFGLVGISFILNMQLHLEEKDISWENTVLKEVKTFTPQKMAMIASKGYSCQTLVCRNVYPWWTFGKRKPECDYVMTGLGDYRADILLKFLGPDTNISLLKGLGIAMKKEGVDYIVSTPSYHNKLVYLTSVGILKQRGECLFQLL